MGPFLLVLLFSSGVLFGYNLAPQIKDEAYEEIMNEIEDQTDLYNDICAGARLCDLYYNPENIESSEFCTDKQADVRDSSSLLIEAHYEGVQCAADNIKATVQWLRVKK